MTPNMTPKSTRRHPAEVTNDRLLTAYERWFDRFSGEERDAISTVRNALHRIIDEDERGDADPFIADADLREQAPGEALRRSMESLPERLGDAVRRQS